MGDYLSDYQKLLDITPRKQYNIPVLIDKEWYNPMKKLFSISALVICLTVILTVSASAAYIDPSAVTYTAQAIAAVVVAVGALITVFRHKIVAFFKKDKGETAKREIHVKEDTDEAAAGTAEGTEKK